MKDLTPEAIEYWNERASEPLRFEPCPDDVCDEIERTHTFLTKEEAEAAIRKAQGLE